MRSKLQDHKVNHRATYYTLYFYLGNAGCPPLTLYAQHRLTDSIVCNSKLGCADLLLNEVL